MFIENKQNHQPLTRLEQNDVLSAAAARGSPSVRILVPVEQRLKPLLALTLADLLGVARLEVLWSDFQEPLRVNCADFSHVLLRGLDQFVVDDPLGPLVEN